MTSIDEVEALVGQETGVSAWLEIDAARAELFELATGVEPGGSVPPFLLLSLLPHLLPGISLPIATPRATINYGLERVESGVPVAVGQRVRARTTLAGVERIGDSVQVRRTTTIETETGLTALIAETVTRLVY